MPHPTIRTILARLSDRYPERGALEIGTPWHTLVLVVLSARTKDEQVLKVAADLFAAYPTVADLARADVADVTRFLSSIGLFRQKAKSIVGLSQILVRDYAGEVPPKMEKLVQLPGVGRKTASVVLASRFGIPALAVDTHVARVTRRLGLVKNVDPAKIELMLAQIVPQKEWATVNRVMVPFGREICVPGKPRCYACPLVDVCAFADKNLAVPSDTSVMERAASERRCLGELKQRVAEKIGF